MEDSSKVAKVEPGQHSLCNLPNSAMDTVINCLEIKDLARLNRTCSTMSVAVRESVIWKLAPHIKAAFESGVIRGRNLERSNMRQTDDDSCPYFLGHNSMTLFPDF